MADKKYEPPKEGAEDLPVKLARGALGLVTGGSFISEFLATPFERRRSQWDDVVGHALEKLTRKIGELDRESLKSNEEFVTILAQATLIAHRNHQSEKLLALRNAVLNQATGTTLREDLSLMFLQLVDQFTPWHLRILRYMQEPTKYVDLRGISMGGIGHQLERAFPELRGQRDRYDQIARDLEVRGLINSGGLHVTMSGQGLAEKRTTRLGDEFLQYIASPIDDSEDT